MDEKNNMWPPEKGVHLVGSGQVMPNWEYLTVKLGFFGFNSDIAAAQFVNEKEIKDWKKQPISAFLNQLGADGWEMSGNLVMTGYPNNYLFLKRPKP